MWYARLIWGLGALLWQGLPLIVAVVAFGAFSAQPLLGVLAGSLFAIVTVLVKRLLVALLPPSTSHGSARFADSDDLTRGRLFSRRGVILGRKGGRMMRYGGDGHLLTFAPTRSGKGVSCVIPNLLSWPGSVVVTDIKGENVAISGQFRESLGDVYKLAPFDDTPYPDCYNPFDFIRVGSSYEVDDVRLISEMLVVSEKSDPSHWEREARTLITGLILFIMHEGLPATQNPAFLRRILMEDAEGFEVQLATMAVSNHPVVSRIACGFSQKEAKERSGVISSAQGATEVFESPLLAKITSTSSFGLHELKERTVSLFLVIPPEYLETYRPYLRLMVGLCTATMTRVVSQTPHEVLFLLDELPALGYMRPIEEGIGYLAGYRAKLWLFVQDLDQLQKTYPKARSLIANCAVRQAFNIQDPATARLLSDMMGTATIKMHSSGSSGRLPWRVLSGSYQSSVHEGSRELMTPAEVMSVNKSNQLLFVQGLPPIKAKKIRYFDWWERRFWGKY